MKLIILAVWTFIFCTNLHVSNAGSNLRTSFDPFRLLTNQFLNTIQPNSDSLNITSSLIANLTNNKPVSGDYNYYVNAYWPPYIGYIILVIIGILFLIFFTLVGMCFCCCRVCCKKCGAKTEAVYNMKRKRTVFNIFLFIFASLILIGAIVAMASSFVFRDSFDNSNPDNDGNVIYSFNATIVKLNNYIKVVKTNVAGPGLNVISQLINNSLALLSPISTVFIESFKAGISFDSVITNAYALTQNFVNLQTYSRNLSNVAGNHQSTANDFSTYLSGINTTLSSELTEANCANVSCAAVRNQLISLALGFNMSNINYTGDINAVNVATSYDISNLNKSISSISNNLVNVTNDANTTFMNYLNSFINNINGTTLLSQLNNTINSSVSTLTGTINDFGNAVLTYKVSEKTIVNGGLYDYVSYGFYGFCTLISIILLVVLLFYVGLCFGTCGGPNFEDASGCNKGKGGGFMMAAVGFSILFGWLIMLVTMIMFLLGGLANTEVCRALSPSNTKQTSIVDSIISPYVKNVNVGPVSLSNISLYQSVMIGCPKSPNIISAFQLSDSFIASIVTYIQTNFIDAQINQTITSISNYNVSTINTADLDSNITNMENITSQLTGVVSTKTQTELSKTVIALDVQSFINNVNVLASDLNKTGKSDVAIRIQTAISNLQSNVTSMSNLQTLYLQFKKQFDNTVILINTTLLKNVKDSLNLLKTQPSNARNKAVLAAANSLRSIVKDTINKTLYNISTAVGDCKGLADSVNSAVNIFCVLILGSFNNIWMGMGWFLLFIIPAVIFAVKLAGIYRITHVESESAAYNHAYMSSNQFLNKDGLEMIRMGRPQKL